jgi:hypothetical protein
MKPPRRLLPEYLRGPGLPTASSWTAFVTASHGPRQSIKHESGITYREANLQNARPFEWAWSQRILLGYINLLVGVEGVGKGNLVAWILARATRGELSGNLYDRPQTVAIIGDEDSFENIWVPRLHAAGADLKQVFYIESGANGTLDVKADAEPLRGFITGLSISVLYFDQLLDNLGFADSWKDKQVRDALSPLRKVVQETNVAMLATMHPNKRQGSFRDRVSGSPAFNAMSRSSMLVAAHPTEPGRVVAVRAKGNYSAEPPAFEFRIAERYLEVARRGGKRTSITTSCLVDERETTLKADDVLDSSTGRSRRVDSKIGQARKLLAEMFADGEERRAADVQTELWKNHKLGSRLVTQAATEIGLAKRQEGFPGAWYWKLG